MEKIPVADGSVLPCFTARPAGAVSGTGVIVAHELFGVTPEIRDVVTSLASAGHLAVAPEFYHRDAPAGHWLARDDAGRAEGFSLLSRLTRPRVLDDVTAAAGWLRAVPGITRVAMIGFSAGGLLAYLAACSPAGVDLTAVLYGGWLTAPADAVPVSGPAPALDLTSGIRGRLLYLVGEDDFLIDAAQRSAIEDALRAAGVEHEMVVYPGTGHAFFWPGTPEFREKSRDDAWSRILALLTVS